jgi:hypothetical protein
VGGGATLSATGGASGNPVTFTVDAGSSAGACTISGTTVTYTGVGNCIVDANQAGNVNYTAAPQVTGTVVVGQGAQTIIPSTPPSNVSIASPPYTPTATGGGSVNPVVITLDPSSTGCSLSAGVVTFTGLGTCIVDFNQAGDANYTAAPQVQQTIAVGKIPQTIVPPTPPSNVTIASPPYVPTATGGGSGNPVVITLDPTSNACSLAVGVVTFTSLGNCIVDFNQAGNANYSAAPQVQQVIAVGKFPQAISFTPPTAGTVGGSATLSATGGASGQPVTFTVDPSSTAGACTISGSTVTYTGAGNCIVDANQAGNANYSAAPQVTGTVAVGKGAQVITFTPPASGKVGVPATLSATGGASGQPVTFTVDPSSTAGACTISGSTVTFTGVGNCIVDANQAGNANFTAAPQVTGTVVVGMGTQTIIFSPPHSGPVGGGAALSATGGASGKPVTFTMGPGSTAGTCSVGGSTVTYTGAGYCVVDANQAGNANYTAAPQVSGTIVVSKLAPHIPVGYRLTAGDGGVFAFGSDSFLGSLVSRQVQPTAPITGMSATADGNGYWLVGSDGNVYTFGDAQSFGTPAFYHIPLYAPIIGIAGTPDAKGYWMVASDGGVFAFGDAIFAGNTYTIGIEHQLDKPVVGMAPTPSGKGYWLVASDGGVFAFGDATFAGNTYTIGIENQLDKPVVGMASTPDGKGYWLTAGDGGVFAFGDATFAGNTYTIGIEHQLVKPMVGMASSPDGKGYWLVAADGGVFAFGDAQFAGNTYTIGIENQLDRPMTTLTEAP